MNPHNEIEEDEELLRQMGYAQELRRRMSGFSNFAISMSTICILAGGVTSFHLGLCGAGGATIGLGWPMVSLFSLVVAMTMGQVASAYPTAGGLYHWSSILGGRGWGWVTAWFNLAGLVTVLAAINVGTYAFAMATFGDLLGIQPERLGPNGPLIAQGVGVLLITGAQALINHLGIRLTTALTDLSGGLIVGVSMALTVALLFYAPSFEPARLVTFADYSGSAGDNVWPFTRSSAWLFVLGFLLPAYTITGFDASAHSAEETVGAAANVPRGMVRAVAVSGFAGWILLSAVILAAPSLDEAAAQGERSFAWILSSTLPSGLNLVLNAGIVLVQFGCGLAAMTSSSRMTYAFARDGGLPWSDLWKGVSPTRRTPVAAIWGVAAMAVAFTLWTPVYATITAVCTIFLYISYVIPTSLGALAYGRTWTRMGPWDLGRWYRPLALINAVGCILLIAIGMQPPYDRAGWILAGSLILLAVAWFGRERRRFPGPAVLTAD
ncbi:amino acid permease [Tundrisphaera lichenicola]|uniref:amino acid permease n=1 Tax=Tundrisphaera lichenicola TaxID=2029860 RepID=UPI003EBAFA6B